MENKKIKICFVSPFAYGLFNPSADLKFGGAEVQLYLVGKELSIDENFDINFIVLDLGQPKEETYSKIKTYKAYRRGGGLNTVLAPFKLLSALAKINPDVVVCRAFGVEVGLSAIYTKIFGKKLIYSLASDHDSDGTFFSGLRGKIFKFGFRSADKLIAQTAHQLEKYQREYGAKAKEMEVIHNSLEIKDSGQASIFKDTVLWVGSSAAVKRPEIFLALAKEFPREKFTMIMTKSQEDLFFWKEIKFQAQELLNIEVIEKVAFDKINEYFSRAKVLVSTSVYEGFANVFLQAAAARTPILSLKVNNDEFITKYNCGLVCDDDFEKLKENLMKLLSDDELRNELGRNAFAYLQQEHDIKKNIEKWKNIFTGIIDKKL
jgi:glycosyltransferase involved in cell wall biosynthesis